MLTKLFLNDTAQQPVPKEGDLYKVITIAGQTFEVYYGYYEGFERQYHDPIPIYPDFIQTPVYTDEGVPFVTAMQDICTRYKGKVGGDSCAECLHFQQCEELFGLCTHPQRRQAPAESGQTAPPLTDKGIESGI